MPVGNPAASSLVKKYLDMIRLEQAKARIQPKQANPLFTSKLQRIVDYICTELADEQVLSLRSRFTLLRDQALLTFQFYAGDRAQDVCNLLVQDLRSLPDHSGLVCRHTFGKTLRGQPGYHHMFIIKKCEDQSLCPVTALNRYRGGEKALGIDLIGRIPFQTSQ